MAGWTAIPLGFVIPSSKRVTTAAEVCHHYVKFADSLNMRFRKDGQGTLSFELIQLAEIGLQTSPVALSSRLATSIVPLPESVQYRFLVESFGLVAVLYICHLHNYQAGKGSWYLKKS